MNIKKLSFFSALLLACAMMCIPGVRAKYVEESDPMVFGLETKTSVEVIFQCNDSGTTLPRDQAVDAWDYYSGQTKVAVTKIILGDTYYGTEMYGPGKNAIPVPQRGDSIFIGWKNRGADDVQINSTDKDILFTGDKELLILRPVFQKLNIHMIDEYGHIPQAGEWDRWEGTGESADVNFSVSSAISKFILPDLTGLDDTMEFVGWYYSNDAGEEVQVVWGETFLEKHDYEIHAVWTPKNPSTTLSITNSVY